MVVLEAGLEDANGHHSAANSPRGRLICEADEEAFDVIQGQRQRVSLGERHQASKEPLLAEHCSERAAEAGEQAGLRETASSLERRLEMVEARQGVDERTLHQLIARVHAGLEAQCAALYREQSEALAKQMAELLAEVQSLHWKALDEGDGTRRTDESTRLGEDSSRCTQTDAGDANQLQLSAVISRRPESPKLGSLEASCRLLSAGDLGASAASTRPFGKLDATVDGISNRLSAWNVCDPKELAMRRLDERVSALEIRVGQLASAPTTYRGQEEDRHAALVAAATAAANFARRQEPPQRLAGTELGAAGPPAAKDFASASTEALRVAFERQESEHTRAPSEASLARQQTLSSSTPLLTPVQQDRASSLRLVNSSSMGSLRRPLAAPPPRTESDPQVVKALSPLSRQLQFQQHHASCPSPATLLAARGRTTSPLPTSGVLLELHGRCQASVSSPANARSVSPPWHDLGAGSNAQRSSLLIAAAPRGASASAPSVGIVMPSTPQQFARRQSSSPSPMSFASRTCARSAQSQRI